MLLRVFVILALALFFQSCISNYARLPNSVAQVYSNSELQQSLMMAAQNGVLIHIPESTTREFEKTEIDQNCRQMQEPLWSEKLSVYLNELRKRPELLNRFHVIELKRADQEQVVIQRDLDGATILSIQFVKTENYGKVSFQTKLPCRGSVAEYFGRDLVKTDYNFPKISDLVQLLQEQPEKKDIPRFRFATEFLMYLAERGAIFKFTHELSFEKTPQGKFVMAELLNKLGEDSKQPFPQHTNYWMQQIGANSKQAQLIQMFAAMPDTTLKAGIRVDSRGELTQKMFGESDLTYLYITYVIDKNDLQYVSLHSLEKCLQHFTDDMSGFRMRKPAASDKESYLKPGYACDVKEN